MEHIRPEKIHAYIERQLKGDEAMATEGHLAVCEDCFKVFSGLKEFGGAVKRGFKKSQASKDCPEDWVAAALIKGELAPKDVEDAEKHMRICDFCLDRAAVYYKRASEAEYPALKAPEAWVSKAVDALQGTAVKAEKETYGFAKVYELFNKISRQLPPLPGYALAAAMAVLLIWVAMPESIKVITISSTEKLAFRDGGAPSSFGFMGRERVEKFGGMEVSKKGGNLEFGWKGIPGASGYTFTLMEKAAGEEIISGLKTSIPSVSVPSDRLKKDELYGWVIGGTTSNGEAFEYTGEFVITK